MLQLSNVYNSTGAFYLLKSASSWVSHVHLPFSIVGGLHFLPEFTVRL